jgi:hypothetical protein
VTRDGSASIQVIAFIYLTAGLVLDSVCRIRREAKRLVYLSLPAANPEAAGHRYSDSDHEGEPPDTHPVERVPMRVIEKDDERPPRMPQRS